MDAFLREVVLIGDLDKQHCSACVIPGSPL